MTVEPLQVGAGRRGVGALRQQVEPVVQRARGGVHLGVLDRRGPAVRVAQRARVVHVADRAVADQVGLLADQEVGRVVRVRGVRLGQRAEDVAGGLVHAAGLVVTGRSRPGVVWKMPWPFSWATMSIAVSWRALSEEWPKLVIDAVPVGVDVVQADPRRVAGAVALDAAAAEPGRSMSHSLFIAYIASTQPVSRLVPEPLPQTSSVPVYVAPFWPPQLSRSARCRSSSTTSR